MWDDVEKGVICQPIPIGCCEERTPTFPSRLKSSLWHDDDGENLTSDSLRKPRRALPFWSRGPEDIYEVTQYLPTLANMTSQPNAEYTTGSLL